MIFSTGLRLEFLCFDWPNTKRDLTPILNYVEVRIGHAGKLIIVIVRTQSTKPWTSEHFVRKIRKKLLSEMKISDLRCSVNLTRRKMSLGSNFPPTWSLHIVTLQWTNSQKSCKITVISDSNGLVVPFCQKVCAVWHKFSFKIVSLLFCESVNIFCEPFVNWQIVFVVIIVLLYFFLYFVSCGQIFLIVSYTFKE